MTRPSRPDPPTVVVPVRRIVTWLTAGWAVALVLSLALPALREPGHEWWPWSAACGMALGVAWLATARR